MSAYVFDRFTQEALDAQYNNQLACPGFRETLAQGTALSAAAAGLPGARDIAWGPHPLERLDIYGPPRGTGSRDAGRPGASGEAGAAEGAADPGWRAELPAPVPALLPVLLFVHGGAWLTQDKEDSAFGAQAFADHGCMWVALGFPDAADVPFADMVASVRRGIAWVHAHIAEHGGDPQRIVLAGHSSGTHLVSQALTHDWPAEGLGAWPFHGAVMVSGLSDLEPVRLSYRNARLNLDAAHVRRYSLAHNAPTVRVPVVVAVAERDTAEFRRQARAMADRLRAFDMLADFDVVPGRHHFDVILDLADPRSKLFRDTLGLLKGNGSGGGGGGSDRGGNGDGGNNGANDANGKDGGNDHDVGSNANRNDRNRLP
ncbi:alpha/beta hydrolase [Pigmentiphaga litoralis]|uniref:alpha/beta hydrolase n=1 Tax=Pigmentiphaga litoralis TaxID=516702 RepID=UPI003B43169D